MVDFPEPGRPVSSTVAPRLPSEAQRSPRPSAGVRLVLALHPMTATASRVAGISLTTAGNSLMIVEQS